MAPTRFVTPGGMSVGWPAAGFYTQAPITSLEIFKGSRFRTFSPLTNRFAALIPSGGTILDIGCGSGEPIARHLIETGHAVTGIDYLC